MLTLIKNFFKRLFTKNNGVGNKTNPVNKQEIFDIKNEIYDKHFKSICAYINTIDINTRCNSFSSLYEKHEDTMQCIDGSLNILNHLKNNEKYAEYVNLHIIMNLIDEVSQIKMILENCDDDREYCDHVEYIIQNDGISRDRKSVV